jgi:hypothetical protein
MKFFYLMLLLMVPNILAQAECTQDATFECLDGSTIVTGLCTTSGIVTTNATCADGTPAVIMEGEPKTENSVKGSMIVKIIYFMGFIGLLILMWWFMKRKAQREAAEEEEMGRLEQIYPTPIPPVPNTSVSTQEDEKKQEGQDQ